MYYKLKSASHVLSTYDEVAVYMLYLLWEVDEAVQYKSLSYCIFVLISREKNSVQGVCSSDITVTATQNWKWLAVS